MITITSIKDSGFPGVSAPGWYPPPVPLSPPALAEQVPQSSPAVADRPARRRTDLLAAAIAVVGALWITSGLWADPNGRALTVNASDQALFEWLLAYGAHALTHGRDLFFTELMNTPDGVNLAVNTSVTVYARPLRAADLPDRTAGDLPGDAHAQPRRAPPRLVLAALPAPRRERPGGRCSAGCSSASRPAIVSHANAHLNWTAGWLVAPVLVWRRAPAAPARPLAAQRRPARRARRGGVLDRRRGALLHRPGLRGLPRHLGGCTGRAGPRRAPRCRTSCAGWRSPRSWRSCCWRTRSGCTSLGPQSFHGTGFDPVIHAEDIAAYGAYPQPVACRGARPRHARWRRTRPRRTPSSDFRCWCWPWLCLVVLWRRADPGRRATLRALAVTARGLHRALLGSAGEDPSGVDTDIPLPYALLGHLPVFDAALPSRLALVVAPVVGLLLAHTVDPLRADPPPPHGARAAWFAGFAVALVPLVPTPLLTGRTGADARRSSPRDSGGSTSHRAGFSPRCRSPWTSDPGRPALAGVRPGPPAGRVRHPGRLLPRARRAGRTGSDRRRCPARPSPARRGRREPAWCRPSPTPTAPRPATTCGTGVSRWWCSPDRCTGPSSGCTPTPFSTPPRAARAARAGRRRLALADPAA